MMPEGAHRIASYQRGEFWLTEINGWFSRLGQRKQKTKTALQWMSLMPGRIDIPALRNQYQGA
jgi:hypothetical protein